MDNTTALKIYDLLWNRILLLSHKNDQLLIVKQPELEELHQLCAELHDLLKEKREIKMNQTPKHRELFVHGFKFGPDESISQNVLVSMAKLSPLPEEIHVVEYSALQSANEMILKLEAALKHYEADERIGMIGEFKPNIAKQALKELESWKESR